MVDRRLTEHLARRPLCDLAPLRALASRLGVDLPEDYLAFMATSDGASGPLGAEGWIELWPVEEIVEAAERAVPYERVLLFAGNGANAIYGFDATRDGEIVEGDWIGLNRDEVPSWPHARRSDGRARERQLARGGTPIGGAPRRVSRYSPLRHLIRGET